MEILLRDYDPVMFTYRDQANLTASKWAQTYKNTPGAEGASEWLASKMTGKTPKERAAFIEKRTNYMNTVEQVFNTYKHEITGAAAGQRELEQLRKNFLNGDMSPSEFKGALEQIVAKHKTEADIYKKALLKGTDVSPSSVGANPGLVQYLKKKGYSDEEINAAVKGN